MNDLFDAVWDYLWESDTGFKGCWITAQEIEHGTGVTPTAMRSLCQEYPASFISSTKGYKLSALAPKAEVRECVQNLLSRAEKITARASALSAQLA